uniref:Putative vesicular amine transporter n=1 Tax=Ixodes ricinus TaxID=34613 RepID=A0A147BS08_IXORI
MGMLSRDPDYGSTHEFPNKDCRGSLDSDSGYSGGPPILKESLEQDANVDAHNGTEVSSVKISPQWLKVKALAWVIPVVYTHFWLAAVISLLAPYFPPLASSRGVPAWKYGFVFSAVKLSMLPGSVIAEKLIANVSPRVGYLGGQASVFLFSIFFGTLYWVQDGNTLLALAITCIAFGGCMYTTYSICLYSLLSNRFHEDGGILIGIMECLWGLGTLVGSIIGGALIDLWAYPLPFYVMGTLLIFSFPAMAVINPKSTKQKVTRLVVTRAQEANGPGGKKYYKLLLDPMFLVNLFSVMLSWAITSFNEPTLEPYLRQFSFTSTQVGSVFMVQFIGYSVGAVLGGIVSKYRMEKFFTFFSLLLSTLAFFIMGPAPFLPIRPNLFFIYLAQIFMGIGMSLMFICPYMHALRDVVERAGYPDTLKTNGVVSSATYQFMISGAVITSPLAGYLVEKYGYRQGSMFMFWLLGFWTVVTFLVWLQSEFVLFRGKREGDQQLLVNDTEPSYSRSLSSAPSVS